MTFGNASIQKYPLGTCVVKSFPGHEHPFEGNVHKFTSETGFYLIFYEDGDSEEMTEEELEMYLKPETISDQIEEVRSEILDTEDQEEADKGQQQEQLKPVRTSSERKKRSVELTICTTDKPREKQDNGAPASNSPAKRKSPSGNHQNATLRQNQNVNSANDNAADSIATGSTMDKEDLQHGSAVMDVIGRRVCRKTINIDGKPISIDGMVSTYFPATQKYRVMYVDGQITDMLYHELLPNLVDGKAEDSANGSPGSGQKKRKAGDEIQESKKCAKTSCEDKSMNALTVLTNGQNLTDDAAHGIVRNVVKSLMELLDDKVERHKYLRVLTDEAAKNQLALEEFVGNGGLLALDTLIQSWLENSSTHGGVLLVMKVLAVLPGVNYDVLKDSKMGRKLHNVYKKCRNGIGHETLIAEFAEWIVAKWKQQVSIPSNTSKTPPSPSGSSSSSSLSTTSCRASNSSLGSDSEPIPKKQSDTKSPGLNKNGKDKALATPSANSLSRKRQLNGSVKKPVVTQSNSANHLRSLMGGPVKPASPRDMPAKSSRLGSSFARKQRRTSILIDTLTERNSRQESAGASTPTGDGEEHEEHRKPSGGRIDGKYRSGGDSLDSDNEMESTSSVRFVKQVYRIPIEKEGSQVLRNDVLWKKDFDDFLAQVKAQKEKMKADIEKAKQGILFSNAAGGLLANKRVRLETGSGDSTLSSESKNSRARRPTSILKSMYVPDKDHAMKLTNTIQRDNETAIAMMTRFNKQIGCDVQIAQTLKQYEEEQLNKFMQQQQERVVQQQLRLAQQKEDKERREMQQEDQQSVCSASSEGGVDGEDRGAEEKSHQQQPGEQTETAHSTADKLGESHLAASPIVSDSEPDSSYNRNAASDESCPAEVSVSEILEHEQGIVNGSEPAVGSPDNSPPLDQPTDDDRLQERVETMEYHQEQSLEPVGHDEQAEAVLEEQCLEPAGHDERAETIACQEEQSRPNATCLDETLPVTVTGSKQVDHREKQQEADATVVLASISVTTNTSCAPQLEYDPFKASLVDQENQPAGKSPFQMTSPRQQKLAHEKEEGELSSSEPNTPRKPL